MQRLTLLYVLIVAVLAASTGLAYYGYSFSRELHAHQRLVVIDTMQELAEEKVYGIESQLIKADKALFDRVDIENLLEFQQLLAAERPAVDSVLILDAEQKLIPGGFFIRSGNKSQTDRFRKLFETQVLPDLSLETTGLGERRHLHRSYGNRTRLFSWTRRISGNRTFYVVVAADLNYLVGTVFPQFFQPRSPRLYQVVDERGGVIYGFERLPGRDVVELAFSETVDKWRVRVAQKQVATGGRNARRVMDLVLIGAALLVIVAGLSVLLVAVRRERRANDLKSEFISNVSHELKTPLSIISMFGEMLASGRTKSQTQATEYAEIIWRESMRLSRLIDNVLDFAKIERGGEVFELAEGDLGEVITRAAELSQHRIERANMTLELFVEPELPQVRMDANAMTLVSLNLIDNAIKYAADGGKLDVRVLAEGRHVVLEVSDYGPGIAADEHKAVFERFYRARAVRLKPIRGSGIGLALVKYIVQAHGGRVEIDGARGQGATFRVWIPVATDG